MNEDDDDDDDDEEEEEEEEEEEIREKTVEKETLLTSVSFIATMASQKGGRWTTRLEVTAIVGEDGGLEISACEVGSSGKGEKTVVSVSSA